MKITWRRRKTSYLSGPVLEPKGMHVIFQKNGKIFKNWGKNVQNLKIFWKRAASYVWLSHAWNSLNIPWLWNNWMNFNEIFRKNANFGNIKSLLKVWLQPLSRQHLGTVWKNHAIYQNNELTFEEKKKAEPFQEVQMNIYQSNTHRRNLVERVKMATF